MGTCKMIFQWGQWGLFLLVFTCVLTSEINLKHDDKTFAFWPSFHNGVTSMKIRKRDTQLITNEGGGSVELLSQNSSSTSTSRTETKPSLKDVPVLALNSSVLNVTEEVHNSTLPTNNTVSSNTATNTTNNTVSTSTVTNTTTVNDFDLKDPGVLKRTLIVFGGFTLLAVAYYIFYRRKNNKNDVNNGHGLGDANQFRYGVLQSEDTREKMELSRIPLTMESEDEEDDDLEIFDLEQKKKSLSYVNLQINDEEIVNISNDGKDQGDALLLDIEDRGTDTLINWSNNGSKSIL